MRRQILLFALSALVAAGCGSATATTPASPAPIATSAATAGGAPATPAPDPTATAAPLPDDTVWLCKPGQAGNPCEGDLDATEFDASGAAKVKKAAAAADPPIDCFYVYPTVSRQKTVNANLTIDPEERAVALAQAAQFSRVCRVYAPMYPQLTLAAIATPSKITFGAALTAYNYLDTAFRNYLANYNHGRGIVFIGHSQGAMMLTELLKFEVDDQPQTRKLLVSALLIGANVTVPVGKTVGADFATIPACSSAGETGCVVAYSSFGATPPADAVFGRVATAINLIGRAPGTGVQIMCVNPASPAGGTGTLEPFLPTGDLALYFGRAGSAWKASTPYVAFPDQYAAHCESKSGATWLQIDRIGGSADKRPAATASTASWGLHTVDVNIALGNLIALVGAESAAFG